MIGIDEDMRVSRIVLQWGGCTALEREGLVELPNDGLPLPPLSFAGERVSFTSNLQRNFRYLEPRSMSHFFSSREVETRVEPRVSTRPFLGRVFLCFHKVESSRLC